MRKLSIGYSVFDQRIAELGEGNVMADIITRVSEGDSPMSIAKSFGIPYVCLKQWVEEHGADMMALARRAHADVLVSNALDEVGSADADSVAVARLRADTYLKIASKQDKVAWGDGATVGGGGMGSITIVIGDVVKEPPLVIEQEDI